jgi:uncharacterized membrane protein
METESLTMLMLPLAVLTRIVANPFANVLQKRMALEGHDPYFINFSTYLLLSIVGLVILIDQPWPAPGWEFYLFSILTGVTGALGNGFLVRSLRTGDLSVLGPINAWKSVIGLVMAFLIGGEIPGRAGLPGIVLIIAGSYVLLGTGMASEARAILGQPAIRYRVLALFLTGVQAVFDKQVIIHSNLSYAFVSWAVGGLLFAPLLMRYQISELTSGMGRIDKRAAFGYLTLSVSIGLMVISTNYTFSRLPVGEALALFQLSIIISVIFGVRIFSERDLLRKLAGAMIMAVGSVLILTGG